MDEEYELNNRMQLRVDILESALSQLGQGIILLSNTGSVEFVTDVAAQMLDREDGLIIEKGNLKGKLKPDNERLKQMRNSILKSGGEASYKSFYIHRTNQKKPYLLLLSKVSLEADAAYGTENVLIIIKDTDANTEYWQERLKSLFGLTNREADFVVWLTEGRGIKEISTVMGIAEDTARQYLKNCFKKMDVNKQHELVCLATDSLRKR